MVGVTSPAGVALAQERSAADIAQARELMNEGLDLREKGNAQAAAEKLRAADALLHAPITGLELGRTYLLLGKLVEAREAFLAVERSQVIAAETAKSAAARAECAKLADQVRPKIPSLVIKVTGVPVDTLAVTIDGSAIPSEVLAAPRLVNPGTHSVVATSTTGGHAETSVDLKEGETKDVVLKIAFEGGRSPTQAPAPEAPAPAIPPDTQSTTHWSPLVYAGIGLAGLGVVVGGVTGALAISKASSIKSSCDGNRCPTSVGSDLNSDMTLGNVSTVSFAVAGVGAAVGVVGLLLSHRQPSTTNSATISPWIGPASGGIRGSF
jgi:hypothetical protein